MAFRRAEFLSEEFRKLGLASATQKYTFDVRGEVCALKIMCNFDAEHMPFEQVIHGVNAYAVFAAPRTSGTEAMVISASWKSVIDGGRGSLNMRGVVIVLSLASFLKSVFISLFALWRSRTLLNSFGRVLAVGQGYRLCDRRRLLGRNTCVVECVP